MSKKLKRELRQLNGLAWKRELDAELGKLEESFGLWREDRIDAFELSDRIHRFHDGTNRELFKFYSLMRGGGSLCVSAAIAGGVIQPEEVSKELLEQLEPDIEHIRQVREDVADPDT